MAEGTAPNMGQWAEPWLRFYQMRLILTVQTKIYTHKTLVMKQLTVYPIATLLLLLLGATPAFSQFNIQVTVNSGAASTTCTDPFGLPPNTNWAVNIANTGWRVYPAFGPCYTSLPNLQFDETYQCYADVPPSIQVCFRAFDNDASLFNPCAEVMSCMAEICMDFPTPLQGTQNVNVDLPDGLASDGTVNLTIQTSGFPGGINDETCSAIDIGILDNNTFYGDASQSLFNNYCAGLSPTEPDPQAYGSFWYNNVGVWFAFTTNSSPGTHIRVDVPIDPSNIGDSFNSQLAVFKTQNNDCNGPFTFVTHSYLNGLWNDYMIIKCPEPNTTYYVLVDAIFAQPAEMYGLFGMQITELGVSAAPQLKCSAEDLGAVPLGGSIGTNGLRTNSCTNNLNPQPATAFPVQKAVWFSFTAPPTGHVLIEGFSNTNDDPIGLQLAVYQTSDNTCNGSFSEVASAFSNSSLNQSLELHCLDPNTTYFLMVDGSSGNNIEGIFSLTISDAGDETPVTNQDIVLCAGESLAVGTNVYSASGSYADTLQLPGGCDSIVNTALTVLPPLELNFQIVQQGVWAGNLDGEAQVVPSGGAGSYTYSWSDGQTSNLATGLVGGQNYCIEVTDANGCMADTCFDMPYYVHFVPSVQGDQLECFGDENGELSLTAVGGFPPYVFTWSNAAGTVSGSGTVSMDNEVVKIDGLPAGQYIFQMNDILFDTSFAVDILQPDQLQIMNAATADASCFNSCDGQISIAAQGGTMPYQYAWSNGETTASIQGLCADGYQVTITDANNCTAVFNYEIDQPSEFIATALQVQEVSCFEGSDGQASVTTNGNPMEYLWNTGSVSQSVANLTGGNYLVTVTNSDGCTATSAVEIITPSAPVGVAIEVESAIVCNGDANGRLRAVTTGPGNSFNYIWSSGQTTASAGNLAAGDYSLTVSNENGCEAEASFSLDQPTIMEADASTNQLTCLTPLDAGTITIEQVAGGLAPYTYSSSGLNFSDNPILDGYTAGPQSYFIKDAGGCIREFSATIDGPSELLVEMDEDMIVELGETVDLDVFVNQPDVSYEWSPASILSCSDCPRPNVQPVDNTLFTVTVTDSYGCTETADIFIEVFKKRKVFVPNAFSPDGDGINDHFVPFAGNDVRIIKEFQVFDRQGNNVFSALNIQPSDLSLGWDGSFNGKLMQPAVFVWFAKIEFIDNEVEIYKGDVVLLN
jgi:gliding motility-associated-like protein